METRNHRRSYFFFIISGTLVSLPVIFFLTNFSSLPISPCIPTNEISLKFMLLNKNDKFKESKGNWMLTAHCSIGKVYDHQHHFQTLVNACWYSRCLFTQSHFNLLKEVGHLFMYKGHLFIHFVNCLFLTLTHFSIKLMDTGCFHILIILNSAAMNIAVPITFWINVFTFFR